MTECPQWTLRTPHYLNVPDTTWEQTEVSRQTGKQARKVYNVPRYLDPTNPNDCNRDGECVVYHLVEGGKAPRGECHQFAGEPTPEMEPINDEAQAISDSLADKWSKPFTDFTTSDEGEYTTKLLKGIEKAFDNVVRNAGGIPVVTPENAPVTRAEYDALLAKFEELAAKPVAERRV